ncbi:hypothetical protein [Deinococcus hohokamensis]|uniref:Uncharacterized protein n=1 Tax=Deinococcus hohokamensis TaxID=309883 RepID=A0ABV9I7T0_9DEIO
MREATRELLLQVDSATEWECPTGFDYQTALREVRAFAEDAAQMLNLNFTLDDQVQDASFFADLYEVDLAVGVWFSAFGRMALAFTENVRAWTSEGVPVEIVHLLQRHGYGVVQPQDGTDMYDGALKDLRGKTTWIGRLFDYL